MPAEALYSLADYHQDLEGMRLALAPIDAAFAQRARPTTPDEETELQHDYDIQVMHALMDYFGRTYDPDQATSRYLRVCAYDDFVDAHRADIVRLGFGGEEPDGGLWLRDDFTAFLLSYPIKKGWQVLPKRALEDFQRATKKRAS